ncbi:hypothetical protein PSN45_003091 [Yamadazyma tenuis]|uniref:Aminotransferase n=1 Tax=Candida tenuis (strain ATCC 10573 / BCRC 21748 / CBS 615 / JCM 9827 / NBRC 10315 / NRRL Y-1498 / VKM Y-70) TaxID=590646 RepID=G3AZF4_CANTC|nr:aminotransferase [Yamadazyma tenuis ATCC 10573]EGV66081.1 aminotransferase [Yamadazyma tenuis ATCC 10573]WEJ95569.1 hypothetical protein PSN45_003091 [Yamadazyma tenuis]
MATTSSTPQTSVSPSPSFAEKSTAPVSYVFQAKVDTRLPEVVGGKGSRFTVKDPATHETREILDGMTGAAVGALGWGDEDVVDFITKAAKNTTYQFPAVIGNRPAEELAEYYIKRSPPGTFAAATWTTSGSESNELALKTIRQYWLERGKPQKIKNLSRYTSYHGYSLGCLSLGNNNRAFPFKDILHPDTQFVKLPEFYPYHYQKEGETLEEYSERLLKQYEDIILKEDPETIASMTVETISGTSIGTPVPTKTYMYGLRKLCTKYDILFHLDEVMCGTGRINSGGLNCWENFLPLNEGPDLQTVGKTLGSGYVTIAGLLVSSKIRDEYVKGSNVIVGSSTYASNAFNCYVALEIQKKIEELNLTKNMFEQGNYLGAQLKEKLASSKIAGEVRGLGGFWTVEIVKNKATREPFARSLSIYNMTKNACFENGLSVVGSNDCIRDVGGDFIMFAPHFTLTKEEADEMVKITVESIKQVEEQLETSGHL